MTGPGPVSLIGGMEHTPGCESIDRRMMDLLGLSRPTVVVVPAASRNKMVPVASERALTHWSRLGGKVRVALAGRDSEEAVADALEEADIIILTGGQSDQIRTALHGSRTWSKIVEMWGEGTAVVGSSMGMIELFELRFKMRPPHPFSLIGGLGLLDGYAGVPHFDKYGLRRWSERVSRRLTDVSILGIDERTGLIGRDGRLTVVGCGSATIIQGGSSISFRTGTEVELGAHRPAPAVLGSTVKLEGQLTV